MIWHPFDGDSGPATMKTKPRPITGGPGCVRPDGEVPYRMGNGIDNEGSQVPAHPVVTLGLGSNGELHGVGQDCSAQ